MAVKTKTGLTPPTEALPQLGVQAPTGGPTVNPTQQATPSLAPGGHPMPQFTPTGNRIGTYTATNNLRNKQIEPGANPALNPIGQSNTAGARDAYGRAARSIGNTSAYSNAAGTARAMAMRDLAKLDGPDRGQIAEDTLKRLISSTEGDYQQQVQGVGRDAAKFGRLGAGMTTSRLGDVASERNRFISEAAGGLASEAASKTLDDRLGVFDARLAGSGQFTSEDLQRAGFGLQKGESERGLGMTLEDSARRDRNELVGERDFAYGRGVDERNELRGERAFQNNMSQQAIDNMIRQRTLEEALLNGEYGRNMDYTQMLLGGGYGG